MVRYFEDKKKERSDHHLHVFGRLMWCSTIRSPLQWPLSWNLWDFYLQPAVAFTGNKATNSVFLPAPTPHEIMALLRIDYILCQFTCAVWSLERTYTQHLNQITRWPPTPVQVSETLCTLWSLSNPVRTGLTQRWSRPWHPPTHTLAPSLFNTLPPLLSHYLCLWDRIWTMTTKSITGNRCDESLHFQCKSLWEVRKTWCLKSMSVNDQTVVIDLIRTSHWKHDWCFLTD